MLFYEPDESVNVYIGKDCAYYHPDIAGADFNDEIQPFGYAGVKSCFATLKRRLTGKERRINEKSFEAFVTLCP